MFRTAEGLPNLSCPDLCFLLEFLAPNAKIAHELAEVPHNLSQIRITAEKLCQFVDEAQRLQQANNTEELVREWDNGGRVLRYPTPPAPEEVSGSRLKKFEVEEARVARRRQDKDPDYLEYLAVPSTHFDDVVT